MGHNIGIKGALGEERIVADDGTIQRKRQDNHEEHSMKPRIHFWPAMLFAAVFAVVAPIAVNAEPDEAGKSIQVVTESSHIGEPRSVRVEQRSGGLWVTGMIKKRFRSRRSSMGHVDLEFLDSTGKVIITRMVDISATRWRRNQRWKRFSKVFHGIPGDVQLVRVKHSPGAHSDDKAC